MARYTGPVDKLSRRENVKLFLKAERDFTDKSGFDRRPYPPGQHGRRRTKLSDYGLQLREKQKLKRTYGVLKRQFQRTFDRARRAKGDTGEALLRLLELRLDNVVHRLGFGGSIAQARQLVLHGHILVNGRRVNVFSRTLRVRDEVSVNEKSRDLFVIRRSVEITEKQPRPDWLELDSANLRGRVKRFPDRNEIRVPVDENLVVEFYSR